MNIFKLYITYVSSSISFSITRGIETLLTCNDIDWNTPRSLGVFGFVNKDGIYMEFAVSVNTALQNITVPYILLESTQEYWDTEIVDFNININYPTTTIFEVNLNKLGNYLLPVVETINTYSTIINELTPYSIQPDSTTGLYFTPTITTDSIKLLLSRIKTNYCYYKHDIDLLNNGYAYNYTTLLSKIQLANNYSDDCGLLSDLVFDTGAQVELTGNTSVQINQTIPTLSGRSLTCTTNLLGSLYPSRIESNYNRTDLIKYYTLNPITVNGSFFPKGVIVETLSNLIYPSTTLTRGITTCTIPARVAIISTGINELVAYQTVKTKLVKPIDMPLVSGTPKTILGSEFLELSNKVLDSIKLTFTNKHLIELSELLDNSVTIKSNYTSSISIQINNLLTNATETITIANKETINKLLTASLYSITSTLSTTLPYARTETAILLNTDKYYNRYLNVLKNIQYSTLNNNDIKYMLVYNQLLGFKTLLNIMTNTTLLDSLKATINTLEELCTEI